MDPLWMWIPRIHGSLWTWILVEMDPCGHGSLVDILCKCELSCPQAFHPDREFHGYKHKIQDQLRILSLHSPPCTCGSAEPMHHKNELISIYSQRIVYPEESQITC